MINALNDLRIKWRAREEEWRRLAAMADMDVRQAGAEGRREALQQCYQELLSVVHSAQPRPLNEASTAKLYKWAGRMVRIFDLIAEAHNCADREDELGMTMVGMKLSELADRHFMNDLYDLFKNLANRQSGP